MQIWPQATQLGRISLRSLGLSNDTKLVMGECLAYSRLQADSDVMFAAWPMLWQPPDAD